MSKRHDARSPLGCRSRGGGRRWRVALTAAPAVACGGLVGENGTIQLDAHDDARGVPRRRRALRDVVRVHRAGQGGRLDRAAARRADEGRARRRLDAAATRARGRAAGAERGRFDDRGRPPSSRRAGDPRDQDRRARHHGAARAAATAVGKWAIDHGFLLTPDAPEMLDFYADRSPIFMAARFDASRASRARSERRRRHADHGDDPDRSSRGCRCASSASVSTAPRSSRPTCSCSPTTKPKLLAGGRGLSLDRNEPANASLLSDLRSDKGMYKTNRSASARPAAYRFIQVLSRRRTFRRRPAGPVPRRAGRLLGLHPEDQVVIVAELGRLGSDAFHVQIPESPRQGDRVRTPPGPPLRAPNSSGSPAARLGSTSSRSSSSQLNTPVQARSSVCSTAASGSAAANRPASVVLPLEPWPFSATTAGRPAARKPQPPGRPAHRTVRRQPRFTRS